MLELYPTMRASEVVGRIWSFYATVAGVLVIAALFALALGKASEGVGDILVVESGPLDPASRKPITQPMRIPVGGRVAYGINWHFVEGGCASKVLASFTQVADADGKPPINIARVSYERPTVLRAVGQPGYMPVDHGLPLGIFPGLWRYKVVIGDIQCATRHPRDVPFVEFDVEIYDQHAPVVVVRNIKINTLIVHLGGKISWRVSFSRRLSVTGVSISTYVAEPPSHEPGVVDVVTQRRPIAYGPAGDYPDVDIVQELPPELHPGHWKLKISTLQTFPDGTTQLDPVGELDFEVVP